MSDIQVTSEVVSDVDPLLQALKVGKQALDDFSTYANSLRIAPTVTIDATTATGAFRAMLAQMLADAQTSGSAISMALSSQLSNVAVSLNLTTAQAQLQTLVTSTFQNINLTFNAPTAIQIGTDIGNAAAATLQAAITSMTFPSGGGGGFGSGGGSNGVQQGSFGPGGVFQPASGPGNPMQEWERDLAMEMQSGKKPGGMGGGLGRGFGARFVLHQGLEWYRAEQKDNAQLANRDGSPTSELEGEIAHRKRHDSAVFGVGELGRNISEGLGLSGILTGGDSSTTDDLEAELRNKKREAEFEKERKENKNFALGVSNRLAESKGGTSYDRAQIKEEQTRKAHQASIVEQHDKEAAEIKKRHDQTYVDADTASRDYGTLASGLNLGYYERKQEALAVKMRKEADEKAESESTNLEKRTAGQAGDTAAADAAEKARKDLDERANNTHSMKMAQAAMLRANGDERGASKLELEAKIGLSTYRGSQESEAAGNAAWVNAQAEQKSYANQQSLKDLQRSQAVTGVEREGTDAARRLSGDVRGAADDDFSYKLNSRLAMLKERGKTDETSRDEAAALEKSMPSIVAEHMRSVGLQRGLESTQSQDRISDIGDSVKVAQMRAMGDTKGAGNKQYEDSLDDQIRKLHELADATEDGIKKKEMLAEADAHAAAKSELLTARLAAQTEAERRDVEAINAEAAAMDLRSQGRNKEAGDVTRNAGINAQIEALEKTGNPADKAKAQALRNKKDAANNLADVTNAQEVGDLNEEARVRHMRNSGDTLGAGKQEIEDKYAKQIREAAGDAPKIAALQLNKQEEIYSFMVANLGKGQADHGYWKALGETMNAGGKHGGAGGGAGGTPVEPGHGVWIGDRPGGITRPPRGSGAPHYAHDYDPKAAADGSTHADWHRHMMEENQGTPQSNHATNAGASALNAARGGEKLHAATDKFATSADKLTPSMDKFTDSLTAAGTTPVILGNLA